MPVTPQSQRQERTWVQCQSRLKRKKNCKILSSFNLFFLLNLCSQTNMQTYKVCQTQASVLRVSLPMLPIAYTDFVHHTQLWLQNTCHVPTGAWLGLVLSLSLYCYGLCKPDLLAHWGREFVWVDAEDCQSGLYHSWERWVLL